MPGRRIDRTPFSARAIAVEASSTNAAPKTRSHRRSLPLAENRGPVPMAEMGPGLRGCNPIPKWALLLLNPSFPRKREPRDFSHLLLGPRFRGDDEFMRPQDSPDSLLRREDEERDAKLNHLNAPEDWHSTHTRPRGIASPIRNGRGPGTQASSGQWLASMSQGLFPAGNGGMRSRSATGSPAS
jgi:hypothetical protein